jgi:sugar/nucleoside kinase (ribokinase family)
LRLGHGGDTLNTAIHLARAGHDVAFFSALGTDPFSARLRAAWVNEGVDDRLILTHPTRGAGLYAITTDAQGERSFTYWRDTSAARTLFALPETAQAVAEVAQARLLYFSLISLAILPEAGREAVLALAAQVRAHGGDVAFDSNYRPRLWESAKAAQTWHARAIAAASIGLPTLEDETALTGETARRCRHSLGRPGLPTHGGESRPGRRATARRHHRAPTRPPQSGGHQRCRRCLQRRLPRRSDARCGRCPSRTGRPRLRRLDDHAPGGDTGTGLNGAQLVFKPPRARRFALGP